MVVLSRDLRQILGFLGLDNRVRGAQSQACSLTGGTPTENSASGPVKVWIVLEEPGVTEDNRELWRLYKVKANSLLVLVSDETKERGEVGYFPWS